MLIRGKVRVSTEQFSIVLTPQGLKQICYPRRDTPPYIGGQFVSFYGMWEPDQQNLGGGMLICDYHGPLIFQNSPLRWVLVRLGVFWREMNYKD